jgi:hypothetical protein
LDPGFLNFPADLSLARNSLAINHGSPDTNGLFLPETDMAGNPRIYGDRIDMGAYEFQGDPTEQYSVSTDLIVMDSIVTGSFAVDSLTIYNYASKPLIIYTETAAPFSLSLDKTGWNNSLSGITIPEGLPVSSLMLYVKFESLAGGDFQNVITMNTENSSCLVAVRGYCKSTEGIHEINDQLNFSVFPNPFKNETRISYYLEEAGDVILSVFHSSGVKVDEVRWMDQPAGINTHYWERKSLPDGIYFMLLRSGTTSTLAKLLIIS